MEQKNTVVAGKSEPTSEKPVETGFISDMAAILASSKSRSGAGGTKIRPDVGYTLDAAGMKNLVGTSVPDQEKVLLNILNSALTKEKPVVTEPELHKLVLAANKAGTLKTKQDPWRIFQYYRPAMLKAGALKQTVVALKAAA